MLTFRAENQEFKEQAEERAKIVKDEEKGVLLSNKEKAATNVELQDLSEKEISLFLQKVGLDIKFDTPEFIRAFTQLGLIETKDGNARPTGIGLLLFGKNPQLLFQNILIRATYRTKGKGEEIASFDGPITRQADNIEAWYEKHIGSQIDRSSVRRKTEYDFPLVVLREAIINAIVHRDYDIEGAPIYFEINDDSLIIKSPGAPVPPLTFEQIKSFNAPSLSRNPKIMYVFDRLEIVEHRGLGFQTIREVPERYGLPLPVVSYDAPYMVMRFPRNNEAAQNASGIPALKELNKEELAGYEWVRSKGQVSKKEYADHFKFDDKKAQRHLAKMKSLQIIGDNGEKPRSTVFRYVSI